MSTWENLDDTSSDEEVNLCLMEDTASKESK